MALSILFRVAYDELLHDLPALATFCPISAILGAGAGVQITPVRWAWSLNAASSVLGSVAALICALYLGFVQTLVIGGLLYLGALAVLRATRLERDSPALVLADRP